MRHSAKEVTSACPGFSSSPARVRLADGLEDFSPRARCGWCCFELPSQREATGSRLVHREVAGCCGDAHSTRRSSHDSAQLASSPSPSSCSTRWRLARTTITSGWLARGSPQGGPAPTPAQPVRHAALTGAHASALATSAAPQAQRARLREGHVWPTGLPRERARTRMPRSFNPERHRVATSSNRRQVWVRRSALFGRHRVLPSVFVGSVPHCWSCS